MRPFEAHKTDALKALHRILSEYSNRHYEAIYSVDYETEALQLIVRELSGNLWENLLIKAGFAVLDQNHNFSKFTGGNDPKVMINLVRVDENHFNKLLKFSNNPVWPGLNLRIAHPINLTEVSQLSVCFLPILQSDPKFWEEWVRDKSNEEFKL